MSNKWVVERRRLPDEDDAPPATDWRDWPRSRPAGITEEDLFRAYRHAGAAEPDPPVTVETVRAAYEAAVDEDDAARPDSREEVRP